MKYFIYSANSILISSDSDINSDLIQVLSSLKSIIEIDYKEYLIDTVQSINSLLVVFDSNKISKNTLFPKVSLVHYQTSTRQTYLLIHATRHHEKTNT